MRSRFPTRAMGPSTSTSCNDIEYAVLLKNQSRYFSIHVPIWRVWLQRDSFSPAWYQSCSTYKTIRTSVLDSQSWRCMVHWPRHGALPLYDLLFSYHSSHKVGWYSHLFLHICPISEGKCWRFSSSSSYWHNINTSKSPTNNHPFTQSWWRSSKCTPPTCYNIEPCWRSSIPHHPTYEGEKNISHAYTS